jgi:hypothetical protein
MPFGGEMLWRKSELFNDLGEGVSPCVEGVLSVDGFVEQAPGPEAGWADKREVGTDWVALRVDVELGSGVDSGATGGGTGC